MRNLRTRHFGHGCIFTSLICTVLFFIYLNYIEVNLLLKNVPLKGTGPYQPFFTKFSSNFSNNSKQIRPQLKINKVENKLDQYIKATNNIVISPELDYLKEDLRKYMKEKFPEKVKLIRNDKREGLIRGRMIGAINATGEVLVFLDSHCEVNKMWLQPLLFAIQKDYRMVVCPLIDAISAYTLKYMSSPILRGGFTWNLHFKWEQVPPSNLLGPEGAAAPIKSPTMAGGIFAINRQYFFEIGQYDSGMNTWGGENLEISFRIWMYGGKLFVIPCSRVGHISRKMLSHKAYEIMDSLQSNSLRLAHVWLDEYKEQFFFFYKDLT